MSDIAIRVEGLSKRYRIGAREARPVSFAATVKDALGSPFKYLRDIRRPPSDEETLWALRDVSFQVNKGEVIGVIGRNGAGKSTLLKILSRIVDPTAGYAEIHGRVGSLLEVGTGFHPELSGRENIYMNGAILGMKRTEIDRRFDEIVAFSEVEEFLDTPVKRYSSGMYVRLAFAVAAHLEPEILIVDEVLAVGDVRFQQKCLGQMGLAAHSGRTVILVSHNMIAVGGLCRNAVVLAGGRIVKVADAHSAIQTYLASSTPENSSSGISSSAARRCQGPIRFVDFYLESNTGERVGKLVSGYAYRFVAEYESTGIGKAHDVRASFEIFNANGGRLTNLSSEGVLGAPFDQIPSRGRIVCEIPRFPFRTGRYYVDLWCDCNGLESDWIERAVGFDVLDGDYYGNGRSTLHNTGDVFVDHGWRIESL